MIATTVLLSDLVLLIISGIISAFRLCLICSASLNEKIIILSFAVCAISLVILITKTIFYKITGDDNETGVMVGVGISLMIMINSFIFLIDKNFFPNITL
jgi:hypothetical protein